jgi:hypothetical protein
MGCVAVLAYAEYGGIRFLRNVGTCQTTRYHVPGVRNIHIHVSENTKPHRVGITFYKRNTVR